MFAWYVRGNKNDVAEYSEDETLLWELMYEQFMDYFYTTFNHCVNREGMSVEDALDDAARRSNLEYLEDYVGKVEEIQ